MTVAHRPGCPEPGWHVRRSDAMPTVNIARCTGCNVVALTPAGGATS